MDFTTNYCGIYWSDGKMQSSVVGSSQPVSELDATCQEHDAAYYHSKNVLDRRKADQVFYRKNIGKGLKRSTYAVLVKYVNRIMEPSSLFAYSNNLRGPPIPGHDFTEIDGNLIAAHSSSLRGGRKYVDMTGVGEQSLGSYSNQGSFTRNKQAAIIQTEEEEICPVENRDYQNMAKSKKQNKTKNKQKPKQLPKQKTKRSIPQTYTQVSTAPVSIGNTVRGTQPIVTASREGARIVGRDLAFSLTGTASTITGWELIGGMPITPCVMPSSVLRSYCQMFAKFKVKSLTVHYVTSSPTSQAGDIIFYYNKDARSPLPDYSNTSFLPFLLSDPLNIIGPQWTNHTMYGKPTPEWKTTNYALNSDLNEQCAGELYVFSKTNATNSPGYILMDYEIEFRELSVNPRAGFLPVTRGQYNTFSIGASGVAATAGSTSISGANVSLRGNNLGNITSAYPTGATNGDIYRCVSCVTASQILNTWTNVTSSNLMVYLNAIDQSLTIDDGFTFYLLLADATVGSGDVVSCYLYPTIEAAISRANAFAYGVTATVTWALIVQASLVYNTASGSQSSY